MSQRVIQQADLTRIGNNLGEIHSRLEVLDHNIYGVDNNLKSLYSEVEKLSNEFHDFVYSQVMANRLGQAETRLVKIRQELEKKYGHHDIIRRTVTGILQADDLGIVKKETINDVTEEMMITTPGYWLAPCLVALAAWINDMPDIAGKAVMEAINRDDEKASLFFGLVCRRANRKQACLKWIQRYLEIQDEENLNRETIIVLDAYASGLMGVDSEGVISKQMNEWLEHLADEPGFVDQQRRQWSDAICLMIKPLKLNSYPYLRAHSKTWGTLLTILQGAHLHAEMLSYLTNVFNQEISLGPIKEQLDKLLDSLVNNYDAEELPLRKEEKFEQLVINNSGDEVAAQAKMNLEQTSFETHKNFTQLLTDAAMNPDASQSSISTQKFALALSKGWITEAYNDLIAKNRLLIPYEIEINIDKFSETTTDGKNEDELVRKYIKQVEDEKSDMLAMYRLTSYDYFCLYGGAAIAGIGIVMLFINFLIGLIGIISGVGLVIKFFNRKKSIKTSREYVLKDYEEKRRNGCQIIRATLAEVVDFRQEYAEAEKDSEKVLNYLEQIYPDQYVARLSESNRKIRL